MVIYFQKIKKTVLEFDPLNLGNSFILYFFLAFAALPAIIWLFPDARPISSLLKSYPFHFSAYYYAFVILSLSAFFLGFHYVRLGKFAERARNAWNYEWQPRRTFFVFLGVFTLGIIVKAIRIYNGGFFYLDRNPAFTSHPLYSLVGLFDWMGPISLAIALVAYFYFLKTGDSRFAPWRYLVWIVLSLEILYGFFSGARGTVLMPLVLYVIARHYLFRKSPMYVFTAFFIIFFILMPLLNINRSPGVFFAAYNVVSKDELAAARDAVKERNFRKLAASFFISDGGRAANLGKYIFDSSILRADQSRLFLAVLNNTHQFTFGESALKFFASLGPPRFIWKSKPFIHGDMSELGRRSGLLAPGDTTSIGPTVLGDWYMNLGIWGITLGMFFIGIVFRFLSEAFIYSKNIYPTGFLIFGITWLHAIPGAIEGWMAPFWAGYVKLFVILFAVHWALSRKHAKTDAGQVAK